LAVTTKKRKSTKKKENGQSLWSIITGWSLIFFGSLLLLSAMTVRYSGGNENWLGPYLGSLFPEAMTFVFGQVSVLIFALASIVWGLWFVLNMKHFRLFRMAGGVLALSLTTSFLLSLRVYEVIHPTKSILFENGGLVGSFFAQDIARPVFGSSPLAPLMIGLFLLILIAVFAFGLRFRHFHFLKVLWDKLVLWYKVRQEKKRLLQESKEAEAEKEEKAFLLDDFTIVKTGKAKPFKSSDSWCDSFVNTTKADVATETNLDTKVDDFDDKEDEIARKERYLLENEDRLGLREKRTLRDEIAELRRIQEQNKWEDMRRERPAIEGFVRREMDSRQDEKTIPINQEKLDLDEETIVPTSEAREIELETLNETELSSQKPEEEPTIYDEYKIPVISDILPPTPDQTADYSEEELQQTAEMLEFQLENFKVKGKVVGISTGPLVTRFEVEPGPGVKVSRFSALQEDLALALKAMSIRILAPIPGKSVVGIEIPNRKMHTVYSRDILESPLFAPKPEKILIVLGKDIMGNPFTMDLAKAPHILIAGQTGSGKSVCINVLMASLLFSKTPDELRLILVDPKVVELKLYEKIPHLLHPVITQPEVAVQALKWACIEMDRRYEVLAKARVRNIAGFNAKVDAKELDEDFPEDENKRMPFLVIVIDELADLMMVAGKEVETSIARIAQKARAVGIHLVLATQRPSVNVITGLIKANLPTRISFKVASQIDARTVMDKAGAEKLLGRGDMLFRATEDPEPHRVHGAFLSDAEAEKLADECSNQNVYYPQIESFDVESNEDGEGPQDNMKLDSRIGEVIAWCINVKGVSVSAVQRSFSVGFSRAGKLVDQLEYLGVCGKSKGNSKPRDILMTEEELLNLMRTLP
jgi:DNA segregation ATPase FtsK/SpoIIIE, S-DNA-T family